MRSSPRFAFASASSLALLAAGCSSGSDQARSRPPDSPYKPCGTEVVRLDRGYDAAARACIWQAYKQREQAEFTTTRYTIEGDPITYNLKITPAGVVVAVDSKDRFGQRGVFKHTCRAFEKIMQEGSQERFGFALSGCAGGGIARLAVP